MLDTSTTTRVEPHPTRHEFDTTWEEIGFAEFPIVTTSLKRPSVDTLNFVEPIGKDAQGQPIRRSWKMVGSKEYGLPRLPDLDVFVAILKLLERHAYERKLIVCTANEICGIAGIARGGQTYQRIRGALIRFQTTNYVAENHFIDPESKERVLSEAWDIITDHRIVVERTRHSSADGLPPSYFAVSAPFLNRLRDGKLKPVDLSLWRELPFGLEKPMFHYLDKNLYQKPRHEIGLRKFSQRIGLTGAYNLAQLKRLCGRPLTTLVTKQFLKEFRFEESKMPDDPWKLVVVPGPRARGAARKAGNGASAPQRIATGRRTRNSSLPGADGEARHLAIRFEALRHGVDGHCPTRSQIDFGRKILRRSGGDKSLADAAVAKAAETGRATGDPEGFPAHISGVLEAPFVERARVKMQATKDEGQREAERQRDDQLRQEYEVAMEKRAQARLAGLTDEARRRVVDDGLDRTLHQYRWYVRQQGWDADRARAWAEPRLLSEYAHEGQPSFDQWRAARPEDAVAA